MIDIKFLRENPDIVKQNIKNKFQDEKLLLVDEVIELDEKSRSVKCKGDELRAQRNSLSDQIGNLMRNGQKEEAESVKEQVKEINQKLVENEKLEEEYAGRIKKIMMQIPNIMHESVPIGKDDSENVENEKFGEPVVPSYEIPYHTDIMESLDGIDLDSARRVAGNGFYYLMGNIARLHSAILSYARDFMINKGFTYCIPPYMIRSDVVDGVMSFKEMDEMMYKIEGEDLYLIGTSEHSMIGKFKGQLLNKENMPYTMTSYSPCFRKEKGSHGIEERGVYRIHQFEKQEMIVVCEPEDSWNWYDKLWRYTVELFRSMEIPVRTLECCSGDLADLKAKSCDVEAWSPRQKKYFEVGSCSNLTDAQARRLGIRIKGEKGNVFDLKLPVTGHIGNSYCKIIRPYQIAYNFFMNQTQNYLEKEIGAFLVVDVNSIPAEYFGMEDGDEALLKIRNIAQTLGLFPTDYSRNTLNQNGGLSFNPMTYQNANFNEPINRNIILAEKYKWMAYETLGLTPTSMGSPSQYSTTEGIQVGQKAYFAQTYNIDQVLMENKRSNTEVHITVAQYCQLNNKDANYLYMASNNELEFLPLSRDKSFDSFKRISDD